MCEEVTIDISCDYQIITIQEKDADNVVVKEFKVWRHGAEIDIDNETGIVTLESTFPNPDDPARTTEKRGYSFQTKGGTETITNGCSDWTASDEATAMYNRLDACVNSCCGGIPVGPTESFAFTGVNNTVYNDTIAAATDACPDNFGVAVTPTYALVAGSEVGGVVVVNAVGTFSFTPASAAVTSGTFMASMSCGGVIIGYTEVSITF